MNRGSLSRLFQYVSSEPDPNASEALWNHRLRLRRPLSRNPFEPDDAPNTSYDLTTIDSPSATQHLLPDLEKSQLGDKSNDNRNEDTSAGKNPDTEWGEQIPSWLNLFYDLAWTATFASLTQNNKFKESWDSVSYVVFFATAWWLWVSQMYYNIDFYTDDWFHLLFIFLQLITFGALAATTQGFDVRNYIKHSPGSEELKPYDIVTMTPEEYAADRLTIISLRVITFVLAISRTLLLIQHLRVVIYAVFTSKSGRFPRQLLIVPASLVISTGLFFGAFAISMKESGREANGSKIRFMLWGVALLVEVVAHIARSQMDIIDHEGVRLRSHGSILERLTGITTIILGEGLNAIAGTFYTIEQAPGFSHPTGAGVVSCGIIVFFLAYLYFEGAAPLKSVRRRAAWVMVHLPWLLSVILLLEGVKNQLLLSSFLNSANYIIDSLTDPTMDDASIRQLLLQAGLSVKDQYSKLLELQVNVTGSTDMDNIPVEIQNDIELVWFNRLLVSSALYTYQIIMDNDTISETTYSNIQKYLNNYNFTLEDARDSGPVRTPQFRQLLEDLVGPSVDNARYIAALCGATFIFLATLNIIQAWPRDRFQWASVFSRYAMGIFMFLVLLLNIGKHQNLYALPYEEYSQRAGVLKWIEASWVLPTLALAYATQFIIDTSLVCAAVWYSNRTAMRTEKPEKIA